MTPKYPAWPEYGFEITFLESKYRGILPGHLKGETGAVIPSEKGLWTRRKVKCLSTVKATNNFEPNSLFSSEDCTYQCHLNSLLQGGKPVRRWKYYRISVEQQWHPVASQRNLKHSCPRVSLRYCGRLGHHAFSPWLLYFWWWEIILLENGVYLHLSERNKIHFLKTNNLKSCFSEALLQLATNYREGRVSLGANIWSKGPVLVTNEVKQRVIHHCSYVLLGSSDCLEEDLCAAL